MLRTYFPPSTYNLGVCKAFLVHTEIELLFPYESLSTHASIIRYKTKNVLRSRFCLHNKE